MHLHAAIKKYKPSKLHHRRSISCSLWWPAIIFVMVLFGGCAGHLTEVYVHSQTPVVCDRNNSDICGVRDDQPVTFNVWGEGRCDMVGLNLGNGNIIQSPPFDFGHPPYYIRPSWSPSYTYLGSWPGPKTVRAYSISNCNGEVTRRINVMHIYPDGSASSEFSLAFLPTEQPPHGQVPNVTPLRRGTIVTISIHNPPGISTLINYGCAMRGCIYDADGEPNSIAPNSFAFPGYLKYSLILRVGTQVIQGGTNMRPFTITQGGPLEVYVNDEMNMYNDNIGGWQLRISVDESNAP